jgi:hypothetical protein
MIWFDTWPCSARNGLPAATLSRDAVTSAASAGTVFIHGLWLANIV